MPVEIKRPWRWKRKRRWFYFKHYLPSEDGYWHEYVLCLGPVEIWWARGL